MSPIRTMYEATVAAKPGDMLEFRIHGSGFLYHMVRNIIGTVANVGLGRLSVDDFRQIMESLDRGRASATAPACGLYLYHVEY